MLFDTPDCIYHYYLVVENTQHWPPIACGFCGLFSAKQPKPMKQQFCLVINSVTLQQFSKDAI